MKKAVSVFGIIGIVLAIGFGIIGCNTEDTSIDNSTIMVCFGDSLTAGTNATEFGKDDKSKSYPAYLQNMVKIQVDNAGVSGDTTAGGLERIQNDVIEKNPTIVIIELGANDLFRDVDVTTTQNNLNDIIVLLKNSDVKKIYLAKFYNDTIAGSLGITMAAKKPLYDTMYNDLKNAHGIELIEDIWVGVWGTDNMLADGIHPIASGYQIMAENYFNAIKPYLQENNMIR